MDEAPPNRTQFIRWLYEMEHLTTGIQIEMHSTSTNNG